MKSFFVIVEKRYNSQISMGNICNCGPRENPVVFFDIVADDEPLGRITMEVCCFSLKLLMLNEWLIEI